MNDIGYLDLPFSGSECCTNIQTATREQLENLLPYAKGSELFHQKEQNPKQEAFFQEAVNLINKRLKRRAEQ